MPEETSTNDPELEWITLRKQLAEEDELFLKSSSQRAKDFLFTNWFIPAGFLCASGSIVYGIHHFHNDVKTFNGMKSRILFHVLTVGALGYTLYNSRIMYTQENTDALNTPAFE